MAKLRKAQLTKEARQDIYEMVAHKSMFWLDQTPEELAAECKAMLHFSVDHEGKTREQLLRTLFLAHMKLMIG